MPLADSQDAYLQIKFDDRIAFNSFIIGGRPGHNQYVTEVKVLYSQDGNNWSVYMEPYGEEKV